ncbi:hypothetical protein HXX76_004969 [Chlamydomonas incerta]|uniref:Uncharacterized protein n=1 Tax=Chlamydomonas incerta TaxID=51695 RepID=A0A835W3W1_CHLIN|nr:hypothetical protein HXX76_004969 [Chlamydomonas incerta]|eukprot:KAG2439617.1 hypothetical protein HXX76_004969 [Chlamydomonas incerta]
MQTARGSYHNLAALVEGGLGQEAQPSPLSGLGRPLQATSRLSQESHEGKATRLIIVSNHLPLRVKRAAANWEFEWDEDALVGQAKEGVPTDLEVMYVGSLPVDVALEEQDAVAAQLKRLYNCCPVFMEKELKEKFYKGCCKQQMWPLFHYVLPMSPESSGRFDQETWQAYVKANKVFCEKVVEESATDTDYVWIHDYHLLVLPSLLRKRFNRIRCGLFLHSPFPSSEIFRTFPKREELLRSLLNADLIGFHTFDYARHFLSCCSRMLGLEHETSRGSITIDYYGRTVGIKIMPTGVNPKRYLDGFSWDEFKWRRGELVAQYGGLTVLVGCDDLDVFKGVELKLLALERLLDTHPEWRGQLVLVQITNPPRSTGRDIAELHRCVLGLVDSINRKYGKGSYQPVQYLERHVPLHERMAFYSIADCAVVTATRDGMNLVPYEYVVCRQGPDGWDGGAAAGGAPGGGGGKRESMLVVSEFVGCSPSLSGAIRVNPWSVESTADGIYAAIKLPREHRALRHDKHWRYVSQHTVAYWATSFVTDLQRVTKNHVAMKCYGLGLGLDTFRMVALDANFRRLEERAVAASYASSRFRAFFLDYDGTLTGALPLSSAASASTGSSSSGLTAGGHHGPDNLAPSEPLLAVLRALVADPRNRVFLFSSSPKADLTQWFASIPSLGLVAENGFFLRAIGSATWETAVPHADFSWKRMAAPILQQYVESTDGSSVEAKESALVWHYRDADPDFGAWQAKELLDHLEGVLSNKPVEIVGGQGYVEIKPQGVSKGRALERLLAAASAPSAAPTAAAPAAAAAPPPAASPSSSPAHGGLVGPRPAGAAAGGLGGPDFMLCVGDDRSDEDMYTSIENMKSLPTMTAEVFACTVGQKPSRAPFYLNDPVEVLQLLARLVNVPLPHQPIS